MNKEQLLEVIRRRAKKLGRIPSLRELRRLDGVKAARVYREFGNLTRALRAARLEPRGSGFTIGAGELLLDWARVARRLRKLPAVAEYLAAGRFSLKPFLARYGNWRRIPEEFRNFVSKKKEDSSWDDVLLMATQQRNLHLRVARLPPTRTRRAWQSKKLVLLRDRPVYGAPLPLLLPALAHEPVNEAGVICLFGMLARKLGFVVERVQTGFPDCEALREMQKGRWQRLRIEFEYESRNFIKHGHRGRGCDVIVCWVHNWPDCPKGIDVIELSAWLEARRRQRAG